MMQTNLKKLKWPALLFSFLRRFFVFAAGWMVLFGGLEMSDLWFVMLVVAISSAISMYTVPAGQWGLRPLEVARFFPFFMLTAVRGGWDVARRVFYRTVPIDPGFISIENHWDTRRTLVLVWIISLLPGTASTVITDDAIIVHVLDQKLPVAEEIQELKIRINKMFDFKKY